MLYQRGFLARPLDVLFSNGTRVAVLRALYKSRHAASGRSIARYAGASPQAAANALSALEKLGVARRSGTGRGTRWRLDKKGWLAAELVGQVLEIEESYALGAVRSLQSALKPVAAGLIVVGSAARGKLTPDAPFIFAAVVGKAGRAPLAKKVREAEAELASLWGLKSEGRVVTSGEAGNLALLEEAWRLLPDEGRGWDG